MATARLLRKMLVYRMLQVMQNNLAERTYINAGNAINACKVINALFTFVFVA